MALNTNIYGYVIDPLFSFCDQGGKTIANGYVRVFRAGTSTPVLTYRNFDGAFNAETIELDNSGRTMTKVIASKGDLYKVCVYDAEHSKEDPVLTVDKVAVIGASVNATNIVQGMNDVAGSGWIKSVSADDTANVSLDPTGVTSEVDTMVKATAASSDYMMPLVHKTGSDPDKKITLGNIFKFVLNFIHSLTDTATEADLTSSNYIPLDGSGGTKKLPGNTIAPKSVQDSLRATSEPKIGVATELTHVVRASSNLSITYTPTVSDSKYFFLRKFAYGSNTTYTIYANDSTGVHTQQTFKSNVPFDSIVELELPTGYDRWLFYRGTTESPFDVALYNISEGAIDKDIETIFNDLSQNPTYDTLWTFSIANNARLDTQKKLSVSSLDLLVEIGEDYEQQYNVFFKDSTSVNPVVMPGTYYNVGTMYHIDLPTGYDTIALYNSVKNTSGSTVSGTAKALSEMSIGYKLTVMQEEVNEISQSLEKEVKGGTVGLEFSIANGQRLDVTRKYDTSGVDFCLDIDENYYDTFNVYFKDSTGVNSPNTSNTRTYTAGSFYHIDIPTGYDSLWFFKGTYNTSGNISVCCIVDPQENTLDYRLTRIEDNLVNDFLSGKKVVCIGDSITQFLYQGMGYVKYLADMTGANAINAGVGGTRYAPRAASSPSPSSVDQAYANLDIYNRVHAWCSGDWADIDAAVAYMITQGTNYSAYIDALKNNPLSGVDVVTLFAGTNDFASGVALGDINSTDTSKTLGALNKIIEELLSVNGNLKIFVFTPTIRYINNNRTDPYYSDNWQNSQGITLKEEAAKIEECARANHIPVCDFYNTLGWNKWNFSSYFTDNEGTHPEKGYDSIARRMSGFIISNAW